jgi:hypothetical protein
MQAQKINTRTDQFGRIVSLPTFKPFQDVELIVLFPVKDDAPLFQKRRPPEKLKGMLLKKGNIMSSAPPDDWGIAGCLSLIRTSGYGG